jgi:hypothetical protein
MAAVTFGFLWLNSAADPTDAESFDLNDLQHNPAVTVTSRQYVDGWLPVTTPGRQNTAKVVLGFCTDAQVRWLKAHQGRTVCFRDPRFEKFYGFYTDCSFAPSFIPNRWSVTFTVTETMFSESA